ncbi:MULTISPECIES: hypothetical protein [unclassified Streptomyces]|uniref:hypothetical protein n=1 Tax=unclassified Streptomyces TaxID=2593676 RepID=UPI003820A044
MPPAGGNAGPEEEGAEGVDDAEADGPPDELAVALGVGDAGGGPLLVTRGVGDVLVFGPVLPEAWPLGVVRGPAEAVGRGRAPPDGDGVVCVPARNSPAGAGGAAWSAGTSTSPVPEEPASSGAVLGTPGSGNSVFGAIGVAPERLSTRAAV